MTTIALLAQAELAYFGNLPKGKKKTVSICFRILSTHLPLDSNDSKEALRQLHKNYTSWDTSSEGLQAWSPLLNSLRAYLNGDDKPPPNLLRRIQNLQTALSAETS